jgi:prophage DNA circulation protein
MSRYAPALDGFPLDIIPPISDGMEKALVAHEFPFRNGAELEDMGMTARTCRFTIAWIGDEYDTYAKVFLEYIQYDQINEFTHPEFGIMRGRVKSATARIDDRLRTIEIDLLFIEQAREDNAISMGDDPVIATEAAMTLGAAQQTASLEADARETLGSSSAAILKKPLDATRTAMEQFTGIGRVAREYVRMVDAEVARVEAFMADVAAPATSLIATINYGVTLPGRVIGSVTRAVERYAQAITDVIIAPSQFLSSLVNGIEGIVAIAPNHARHVRAAGWLFAATRVAVAFAADETARASAREAESAAGFDVAGNRLRVTTPVETLTVNEIERTLVVLRERIQAALDDDRSITALKDAADALARHVSGTLLLRDRIIEVVIDGPMPLHRILANRGLPCAIAERTAAINPRIPNPTFCDGEVMLYDR